MSFRSRKYACVWLKVANFGLFRPPRSKTELPSSPFLIMITTRTSGVSGKLSWWFITLLTLTFHCPSNSIIDPFPSSKSISYFHNFRNRLTWPPRRLQMPTKNHCVIPESLLNFGHHFLNTLVSTYLVGLCRCIHSQIPGCKKPRLQLLLFLSKTIVKAL